MTIKENRFSYASTYLKARITKNRKHTIDSQKQKRKELKHNAKENHQTTKGKMRTKVNNKHLL